MNAPVRDYPKLASDIISFAGGKDNISSVARCATRLRLILKETPADAHDKIGNLPGVITTVEKGGQFQVVIGNRVGEVYDSALEQLGIDPTAQTDDGSKPTLMNRIIAMMSAVFAPFIYVLAAAGLIQGALIIIVAINPEFEQTGTYEVFSMLSWTPFTFLPILIAITAAQYFKTNLFIAVTAVAALVTPSMADIAARVAEGERITLFGLALSETTYTSTVLPPLFMVWGLSYLERFVRTRLPDVLTQLFTPLICLVIAVPLAIVIIGPASNQGAIWIADGFNWLVAVAPPVAAGLVGAFWQVIVIFGVHWGVTPMVLANFAEYGSDPFQAFQTAAVIGQVGAAFGVILKSRSKDMRKVAASATLTGMFGITEPAIYGVTLRLKRPFIVGCTAGAIGAIIVSLFGSRLYVFAGLPGPLIIMNAYSPGTNSLLGEIIGCAVAFFGAAAGVYFLGFKDVLDSAPAEKRAVIDAPEGSLVVTSPLSGTVLPLNEVDDEVFAGGSMGSGIAILPEDTKVYAPFDGEVVTVLPSKHAVGVISTEGIELLIHVGLDTVGLNGAPFTAHVAKGQKVTQGQLLLEFDPDAIEAAGLSLQTPVIITNSHTFATVTTTTHTHIAHGDDLLAATPHALEGAQP